MMEHDEHDEHDEQDDATPAEQPSAPSGDPQTTPEPNVDRTDGDDPEAPAAEPAAGEARADDAIGDFDDHGHHAPEAAVAESLRVALGSMREEADRIASLGTGDEQVSAAERFAEDAGRLDEQVGAAARAEDANGGN